MSDIAHKATDAAIEALAKKLQKYYSQVWREIKKQLQEMLSKMNLSKGMTPQQLYAESLKYDRLTKLEEQLSKAMKDANSEAVKMINKDMTDIYQTNYNFEAGKLDGVVPLLDKKAVYSIINAPEGKSPFDLVAIDSLKDRAAILDDLRHQLVNGIASGESIPEISKRVQGVMNNSLSDSVRIARTETTRVEAEGRMAVGTEAQKLGFKVYKRWVATDDDRTRPSHRQADGQEVPFDQPFIVGGEKLMYPGDPSGSAGNVINCRCTVVTISRIEK